MGVIGEDGGGIGTRGKGVCRSQHLPDIVICFGRQSQSIYLIGFKLHLNPFHLFQYHHHPHCMPLHIDSYIFVSALM